MPRPVGPSSGVTSRPSFVSGSADTMERQIKKRKDDVYRQTLANLAKLEQEKQNEDKPWYEDVGSAIGGGLKWLYDNAPETNPISTPVNMGGGTVSMGGQGTGKSLVTEPARLSVRRAVGDITALPGVGEDSPSYTAEQIRQRGVAAGVFNAAMDYLNLIGTVAPVAGKVAKTTSDVANSMKLARMERELNPFPRITTPSSFIDVVEGSRLPARVADVPVPATTQAALPPATRQLAPAPAYRTTRAALAEDMAVTAPDTPAPAGRVAPGFVSPEPVAVGNVATLPDGASVRLDAPEQSVEFVAAQGPLDQVPTQHLWQAISENAGEGKRFDIVGTGGGMLGMTRFRDTNSGQYLGLKYQPSSFFQSERKLEGPLAEVLSNDIATLVGFPDMNLRLVPNNDRSFSVITELAQSVYGGNIYDSYTASVTNSKITGRSIANSLNVEDRIRKGLLDDIVMNMDTHKGNVLYSELENGDVRIVPIDYQITFEPLMRVTPDKFGKFANFTEKIEPNFAIQNLFHTDPDTLRAIIRDTVVDVRSRLTPQAIRNLETQMKSRIEQTIQHVEAGSGLYNGKRFDADAFRQMAFNDIDLVIKRMQFISANVGGGQIEKLVDLYFDLIKRGALGG